ncbi:hypothetical protein Ddye_019887 [Dipteronia dyeriana]|uniref:Putative plant transposon protein domain-containing protein n=1 Tax=Dipteronia dyeriana TaxID=168575 RepID=A0AAD9TYX6_9ROSI|nr:hypothetical protein Ddye_019887 [Dipteronia dyeriana]
MVPYYFQRYFTILVRGVEVRITSDDLNEFYNTELLEDPEVLGKMRDGVSLNEDFVKQNVEFVNQLVIQSMKFWVAPIFHIKHINLELELGLWNIFISHALRPMSHKTTISFEVATILFCIKNDKLINVGLLIRWVIAHIGCMIEGRKATVHFPLLYHRHGLKDDDEDDIRPISAFMPDRVEVETSYKSFVVIEAQIEDGTSDLLVYPSGPDKEVEDQADTNKKDEVQTRLAMVEDIPTNLAQTEVTTNDVIQVTGELQTDLEVGALNE